MPKKLLPIIKNDQLSDDEKISQSEAALPEGASWYEEDVNTHKVAIHVFIKKANEILFEWVYQRYLKQDKSLLAHQDSKKNTLLHSALANANEIITLRLLESGIDFQMLDSEGFHPIHIAAQKGYLKVVEFLYHQGVNLNQIACNSLAYTPLIMACEYKHTKLALKLIQWGADINQYSREGGMYPLHYAAKSGLEKVIQALLVEKNVDLNQLTENGYKRARKTALYIACENGQKKVTLKLIRLGADVNIPYLSETPLHVAIKNQLQEVVEAILAKEAELNQKTVNGGTLLLALRYNNTKTALRLINDGVNIQVRSKMDDGYNPIGLAVKNNQVPVVNELLKRGVNVNETANSLGHTPLILACEYGALESLKILLQYKPQLNIMSETGLTAMHVAATAGHIDVLKVLFEKKLYLNWHTIVENKPVKESTKSITPVSIAIETLRIDLLKFLLKQESTIQKQFAKLDWNTPRFLEQKLIRDFYFYRIRRQGYIYSKDADRKVATCQILPIHLLAFSTYDARTTFTSYSQRLERYNYKNEIHDFDAVLKFLIEQGININSVTVDTHEKSLLHLICEVVTYDYDDGIILPLKRFKTVVKHGGNPYLKDAYTNTPLVYYYHLYRDDDYEPDAEPFDFLIMQGFKVHRAFNLKNMHINTISNRNIEKWHELILNYVPRDYVKLCQGTHVSKENLGGLLGRKIIIKDLEAYKDMKKYFLAFGLNFEQDEMKEVEAYLNFSKWAITEVDQLATINLSVNKITLYLQILGTYLMARKPVEDKLFDIVGDAVICLMKRILIKKELTLDHLKALKCILENAKYLADEFKAELNNLYLRAYRELFNQLPSLAFFALDKLLQSSIKTVNDDFTAEQSVMDEQYKNYPVKTKLVQTGYHQLTLLFQKSHTIKDYEQTLSLNKNLKRAAPESEEDEQPKKRQKHASTFS